VGPVEQEPVFNIPAGFRPPRWLPKGERKHIPERHWTWEQLVARSQGHKGDAWYHPRLPAEEIERIEMGTVRDAFEIPGKRKPNQGVYWRHLGMLIGTSKGKDAEYVYVYYAQDGAVHGLPITLEELRKKGDKP
jgi:hypothetical protein